MIAERIEEAMKIAKRAASELSWLAEEMDEIGTDLDQRPNASADAAHLITRAEEARGAAKLLEEWSVHLRRLRAAEESAAGAG